MNKLPKCPSRLITMALKDLKKSIDMGYEVDMGGWVTTKGDTCTVCLAGAVMAQRFIDMDEFLVQSGYDDRTPHCVTDSLQDGERLEALNHFRLGRIDRALALLRIERPENLQGIVSVPDFESRPVAFIKTMESMAQMLRENNL